MWSDGKETRQSVLPHLFWGMKFLWDVSVTDDVCRLLMRKTEWTRKVDISPNAFADIRGFELIQSFYQMIIKVEFQFAKD